MYSPFNLGKFYLIRLLEKVSLLLLFVFSKNKVLIAKLYGLQIGNKGQLLINSRISGHKHIKIGDDFLLSQYSHLKSMTSINGGSSKTIIIGNNVYINEYTIVDANLHVEIGDDTIIGPMVLIIDSNHCYSNINLPIRLQGSEYRPVIIKSGVWVGAHSVILPGVTIGEHSVIAANSTVLHDVPPYTLVAGSPAKVIKKFSK